MAERRISVDHSTVHRWAIKLLPALHQLLHRRKRLVGLSWRMNETYLRLRGRWAYLYRAVDAAGKTIDFLLSSKSNRAAAQRFFRRAMARNGSRGGLHHTGRLLLRLSTKRWLWNQQSAQPEKTGIKDFHTDADLGDMSSLSKRSSYLQNSKPF
jgi:hypothetical protein